MHAKQLGMYLRMTQRRNKDGSVVRYYGLAENVWNAERGRSEARPIYSFGRADKLDKAVLERLASSLRRVVLDETVAMADAGQASLRLDDLEISHVFELGVVHLVKALWDQLGIGAAIGSRIETKKLKAPHLAALLAMVVQRIISSRRVRYLTVRRSTEMPTVFGIPGILSDASLITRPGDPGSESGVHLSSPSVSSAGA